MREKEILFIAKVTYKIRNYKWLFCNKLREIPMSRLEKKIYKRRRKSDRWKEALFCYTNFQT